MQKALIDDLFQKKRGGFPDTDLKNMREALGRLQNPQAYVKAIHVAGTNGKGSTCTKIAKAYELDGCRVGLYTSPHIDFYTERIHINSIPISEADFVRHLQVIYETCGTDFSFFELMTLVAFLYFRENNVEIAVMETGIGGRKDATNLCCPILSVITSVSLDHTEMLGDTLEAIAREKAGIIKPGVPVVIGPHVPHNIIQECAIRNNASLYQVQGEFSDFDLENSKIALQALSLLPVSEMSAKAAMAIRPKCRFELAVCSVTGGLTVPVVLDVAHNPDGIARLMQRIEDIFSHVKYVVLLAVCKDKLYKNMLEMLPKSIALVCTEAFSSRALPAEELGMVAEKIGIGEIYVEKELEKAVSQARGLVSKFRSPLIVTGTFYMMGEVKRLLGVYPAMPGRRFWYKN